MDAEWAKSADEPFMPENLGGPGVEQLPQSGKTSIHLYLLRPAIQQASLLCSQADHFLQDTQSEL